MDAPPSSSSSALFASPPLPSTPQQQQQEETNEVKRARVEEGEVVEVKAQEEQEEADKIKKECPHMDALMIVAAMHNAMDTIASGDSDDVVNDMIHAFSRAAEYQRTHENTTDSLGIDMWSVVEALKLVKKALDTTSPIYTRYVSAYDGNCKKNPYHVVVPEIPDEDKL
jgi:hypothetical protein